MRHARESWPRCVIVRHQPDSFRFPSTALLHHQFQIGWKQTCKRSPAYLEPDGG